MIHVVTRMPPVSHLGWVVHYLECSCGWLAAADTAEQAERIAREHVEHANQQIGEQP